MFRAGVLLTSSIRIAKRKGGLLKTGFPPPSFPCLYCYKIILFIIPARTTLPVFADYITNPEAPVIQDSTDNHGLDKPIWTDGSDEDFLAICDRESSVMPSLTGRK